MLSISESDISVLEKKASQAANMLKSISNKWRLLILCQLVKGEISVGALSEIIDLSQSALSQHLAVLREADLVSTRRESQAIFYSLKGDEVTTILAALYQVYCAPSGTSTKSGKGRGKR